MGNILIEDARIVYPGEGIRDGSLLIADGKIAAIDPDAQSCPAEAERVDARGDLLTPGLIDIHTHGIHEYPYEGGPDQLLAATERVAAYGCTCVLPTVVPKGGDKMLADLRKLSEVLPAVAKAAVPGLHLEGPFVALSGAGCITIPGDVGLLDEMLDAAHDRVSVMSISPETENIIPVIERLVERHIVPFITHTRADVEQTQAAIEAGARHGTHFYDVFYPPEETDLGVRPVGCVEAILADPRVTVDFICDGIHVHPTAIKSALAAKGFRGVMLITDSNIGAGLPPGVYQTPNGPTIRVHPEKGARILGDHPFAGALAGSALTMNRGIANLMDWLDLPPAQVWAMGTANPARLLGLAAKGGIKVGVDADLVLWNDDFTPIRAWVGGHCVYECEA